MFIMTTDKNIPLQSNYDNQATMKRTFGLCYKLMETGPNFTRKECSLFGEMM
jgi:hypothetical protein